MPWEGVQPPAEPAGYDPANKYADPVVYFKHREAKVAAEYVKVAEAKVRSRGVPAQERAAAAVAAAVATTVVAARCLDSPPPFLPSAADPQEAEAVLQGVGRQLPAKLPRAGAGVQGGGVLQPWRGRGAAREAGPA